MSDSSNAEMRGSYRLTRELGRGGMGTVYEAWEARLARRVAVKFIHPHLLDHPGMRERFAWEAQAAARVEHPNVVRVYRVDTWEGEPVIEMQYVVGTPLREVLRGGPLTPEQGARLLEQLLKALAACHAQQVVHCDLKPGNLLITAEEHLWLTDFGVAQALFPVETPGAAVASAPPGAPAWGTTWYMPPEAFRGAAPAPAWDLYAAGMVAFEMMAGAPPFRAESEQAWVELVCAQEAPRLETRTTRVSRPLADLVAWLIARDPAARLTDAEMAVKQLRQTPEFQARPDDTLPPLFHARPGLAPEGPMTPENAPTQLRTPTKAPVSARRGWIVVAVAVSGLVLLAGMGAAALARLNSGDDPALAEAPAGGAPAAAPQKAITDLTVSKYFTYFAFDDGVHGRELWGMGTDGESPYMLADLVPGPGSSDPRRFMLTANDELYFAASTPAHGEELWIASDTGGGGHSVREVRDVLPGPMGSEPQPVASKERQVLFYATTLNEGRELWCSNGYANQTAIVADAAPGRQGSYPERPIAAIGANEVYLIAYGDAARGLLLWRYDFLTNVLLEVADVAESTNMLTVFQGRLFFAQEDGTHGAELWVHDPANNSTQLFADLWPGPDSSSPGYFYAWHDHLLFRAKSEAAGEELWVSDATVAGTALLADINPGPAGGEPFAFVGGDTAVFFRAQDAAHGKEPWVTDLSPEGTQLLADVRPGPESSTPYNYAVNGKQATFSADDGMHGEELYCGRPVPGGWRVSLITDVIPGPAGPEPHDSRVSGPYGQIAVGHGTNAEDVLMNVHLGELPDIQLQPIGGALVILR
ncbi:MAG: protein kinase [Candidatus Hydrogenedentes bacterium]|nr:protein kinase [Candidatus Hydrogenedentota bacterium]